MRWMCVGLVLVGPHHTCHAKATNTRLICWWQSATTMNWGEQVWGCFWFQVSFIVGKCGQKLEKVKVTFASRYSSSPHFIFLHYRPQTPRSRMNENQEHQARQRMLKHLNNYVTCHMYVIIFAVSPFFFFIDISSPVSLSLIVTALLAYWLRRPTRERKIRGSIPTGAMGIFPGRVIPVLWKMALK